MLMAWPMCAALGRMYVHSGFCLWRKPSLPATLVHLNLMAFFCLFLI